jgi:hypothetical protein
MTGYRPVVRAREGFMLAYVNRSMGPIGSIMAWHDRKGEWQLVLKAWQDLIEAVPAVHHRTTPHWRAAQLRLTSKAGTHCAFAGIDGDTGSIALEINSERI